MKCLLPKAYGERPSEAINTLADRINHWTKDEHGFSAAEIDLLLWALSVDNKLQRDFYRECLCKKAIKHFSDRNA